MDQLKKANDDHKQKAIKDLNSKKRLLMMFKSS